LHSAIEGSFTVATISFGVFVSGVERLLQGWDAILAQSKSAMMAAPSVHAQAKLHREWTAVAAAARANQIQIKSAHVDGSLCQLKLTLSLFVNKFP
jgi:hypothetical protein